MNLFLRGLLFVFGIVVIVITLSIIFFGANTVSSTMSMFLGLSPPTPFSLNGDNELRFYAVYFFAFGALNIYTATNYAVRNALIPWLMSLFFLAGLARGLSYFQLGAPDALFMILWCVELVFPIVVLSIYWVVRVKE